MGTSCIAEHVLNPPLLVFLQGRTGAGLEQIPCPMAGTFTALCGPERPQQGGENPLEPAAKSPVPWSRAHSSPVPELVGTSRSAGNALLGVPAGAVLCSEGSNPATEEPDPFPPKERALASCPALRPGPARPWFVPVQQAGAQTRLCSPLLWTPEQKSEDAPCDQNPAPAI